MNIERFVRYVELFVQYFEEDNIEISWQKESAGFRSSINLEDELPKIDESFSSEEFINVGFEIISISTDIINEIAPSDDKLDKYKVVSELFLIDELKEQIFVSTNSISNRLSGIDYEILTKRSVKDPTNIITYTALINLLISEPYKKNDFSQKVSMELSKTEIKELVDELSNIITRLDNLK